MPTTSRITRLFDSPVDTFVAHSEAGSLVLSDGQLVGHEFRKLVGDAVTEALRCLLDLDAGLRAASEASGTLTILRGGLNFALNDAVEAVTGTPPTASFMTSQRRVVDGSARVSDDSYQRFNLKTVRLLVIGDIAATGMTMENAMLRLSEQRSVENLQVVIVTIGTSRALERLRRFSTSEIGTSLRERGWSFTIVYLESIFSVYSGSDTSLGQMPQTDFVLPKAVFMPEFARTVSERPSSLLERCAIYDGGVRSFEPADHLSEVGSYWDQLLMLARSGGDGFARFLRERGLYKNTTIDHIEVTSDARLALSSDEPPLALPTMSPEEWTSIIEQHITELQRVQSS